MNTDNPLKLENSYQCLPAIFFSRVSPAEVFSPRMAIFNHRLAYDLGLDFTGLDHSTTANLLAGNKLDAGIKPIAQAYAGHQFGHFTMLGDGRAHLLGEIITPSGRRFDIQLKGSGPTPYSRNGDGRASVGPMLREYLISEAMAALGIPTTRALAVVRTGEHIQRETLQPGAILTRVADSHIRVGTFEYAAALKDRTALEALLNYTIQRHTPELSATKCKAIALLDAVIEKQINLIVHWMRVGFIHGVMNTDNMSISGETIDYGPCAFMDTYDPDTVFSSIDTQGRYAYANQPAIAQWNLTRFAESLLPLIDGDIKHAIESAQPSLNRFAELYRSQWLKMMRRKLGLFGEDSNDLTLITDLLNWMKQNKVDYTNTFVELSGMRAPSDTPYDCKSFRSWHNRWQMRRQQDGNPLKESKELMHRTNPVVIPRNHRVEEALDAAQAGDMKPLQSLLDVLQTPYAYESVPREYQAPRPHGHSYQTFCGT